MIYRPEIDGLRALAVMAVLVFHFYPGALPDGYLGVDLFFVISGFLISLYILEETNRNSFSFSTFYARRIKRILPVTFTVLVVTFLVGFVVLIGPDFNNLLKSLIATLTFTANIFFWRDGGYFSSNDALKPLLHMWSLGVEEQFYLFFPLIFVTILKFCKSFYWRLIALSIFSSISFAGNYYLISSGGFNPAFFLTPFRAWEFGLGAIAALFYNNFYFKHTKLELIASVVIAVLGFTLFPRFVAPGFLVAIATAYFLSKKYIFVSALDFYFSNAIVKKVGLISFSLYLWHWPVLAFSRYVTIDSPSIVNILFCIFLTFIFSGISYNFIEEKFRKRINISITIKLVLGVLVFLVASSLSCLYLGIPKSTNEPASIIAKAIQTNYRCDVSDYLKYGGSRACLINKDAASPYHVALIGNSHAQMYVPALQQLLKSHGESGLLIPLNGCLPTVDVNISEACLSLSKLNYKAFISDENIKIVIFALTWYHDTLVNDSGEIVNDANKLVLSNSLLRLIEKVKETGREVFLVGPIQVPGYDLPSVLSRKVKFLRYSNSELSDSLRVSRDEFDRSFKEALPFLEKSLGGAFLRPNDLLCDSQYCYFGDVNGVYFSDSSHLSGYGASKMTGLFSIYNN